MYASFRVAWTSPQEHLFTLSSPLRCQLYECLWGSSVTWLPPLGQYSPTNPQVRWVS